jgi:hypothetical protein
MLPTKFRFIWSSGFAGKDFFKSANQKQELPVTAMFVNRSGQHEHYFYVSVISLSGHDSFLAHLAITWRPSSLVCRPLAFRILIFSETSRPNEQGDNGKLSFF